MTNQEFNKAAAYMLEKCINTLGRKNAEYSAGNEDRLIAFKSAAGLSDITPEEALSAARELLMQQVKEYIWPKK